MKYPLENIKSFLFLSLRRHFSKMLPTKILSGNRAIFSRNVRRSLEIVPPSLGNVRP